MSMQFLKFSYHLDAKKISAYLKMTGDSYDTLRNDIEKYIFVELQQPRSQIRTYWIDEDNDEIEILNDTDYYIFLKRTDKIRHLHVVPIAEQKSPAEDINKEASATTTDSATNKTEVPPPAAGQSDALSIHKNVECDSCLMCPIVGFRYKCIECSNYDLCENCETKHIHSNHLMLRMPKHGSGNCVSFLSGRLPGRRHSQRCRALSGRNEISIVVDDGVEEITKSKGVEKDEKSKPANGKECYHAHKQRGNRRRGGSLFSHLCTIMNDLAEGGIAATAAHITNEPSSTSSKTASATTTKVMENKTNPFEAVETVVNAAHESFQKAADLYKYSINAEDVESCDSFATSVGASEGEKEKDTTNEKADDDDIEPTTKNGNITQVLNHFTDMFAEVFSPFEKEENDDYLVKKLEKSSSTVVPENLHANPHSEETEENKKENEEPITANNFILRNRRKSIFEVVDSESENNSDTDSDSDSFIKVNNDELMNQITPKIENAVSDEIPERYDFHKLSAGLKELSKKDEKKSVETTESVKETVDTNKTSNSSTTSNTLERNKSEEKRAVPVYHADPQINTSVRAMMSMGFSNEGAWLTQLLESVNGNISDALDAMSVAQRYQC